MRVRIVSDGTVQGTKVVTLEGEVLEGVQLVNWSMAVDDQLSSVLLELKGVPCDIVTTARRLEVQEVLEVPEAFEVEDENWQWLTKKPPVVHAEVSENVKH